MSECDDCDVMSDVMSDVKNVMSDVMSVMSNVKTVMWKLWCENCDEGYTLTTASLTARGQSDGTIPRECVQLGGDGRFLLRVPAEGMVAERKTR